MAEVTLQLPVTAEQFRTERRMYVGTLSPSDPHSGQMVDETILMQPVGEPQSMNYAEIATALLALLADKSFDSGSSIGSLTGADELDVFQRRGSELWAAQPVPHGDVTWGSLQIDEQGRYVIACIEKVIRDAHDAVSDTQLIEDIGPPMTFV